MSRKSLHFFLICAVTGIITAAGFAFLRNVWRNTNCSHDVMKLTIEMCYDAELDANLKEMQAEDIACMFYQEKEDTVLNPEFNRSEKVSLMGIAGNSYVYAEDANPLFSGENGCCLLSADVAIALFGTNNVTGKSVKIGGNSYVISGIMFRQKNLCMYELDLEEKAEVTHMVYYYSDNRQKNMVLQQIQNICGVY